MCIRDRVNSTTRSLILRHNYQSHLEVLNLLRDLRKIASAQNYPPYSPVEKLRIWSSILIVALEEVTEALKAQSDYALAYNVLGLINMTLNENSKALDLSLIHI